MTLAYGVGYYKKIIASMIFGPLPPSFVGPMMRPMQRPDPGVPFYLYDGFRPADKTVWDPWPVRRISPRKDPILDTARAMIHLVNSSDFDHRLDPMTLLPASNGISGRQERANLYSIRSPSTLPFKVNLWMGRGSRIMLRKGCLLMPLHNFLVDFKTKSWESLAKASLWNLLLADKVKLKELHLPESVQEELYRRWWLLHGFPFRELPGELRNLIISLIFEQQPQVYSPGHCDGVCRRDDGADGACTRYHPLPPTSLYLIDKQICQEAKYLMFRRTTFQFHHGFELARSIESMTGFSHASLRFVSLKLTTNRFLRHFGAKSCVLLHPLDGVHECNGGRCGVDPGRRPTWLLKLANLETLEIVFPTPHDRRWNDFAESCQRAICWVIFAAIYKYVWWLGVKVLLDGAIKDDQKDCFQKLLDKEEPIELLETLPESEHFNTMGVISCRRSSCHCHSPCILWFDKAYHPEDRLSS